MGFIGNLMGGGAARHAANVANVRAQQTAAQLRKAGQAAYNDITGLATQNYNTLQTAGQQAYSQLTGIIPGIQSNFAPQIAAGQAAAKAYQSEIPYLSTPFAPTMQQLAQTPGYQFAHDQGLQATQNAAAARGLGISGNALEAAANYATGLAQNTYAQDAQIYQNNQNNIANNLLNGMNSGTTAANASGSLTSALQQAATGAKLGTTTTATNLLQGARQTAQADLLNEINGGASTSLQGDQMAAAGQIAYNNAIAAGIQAIDNTISAVGGAMSGMGGGSSASTQQAQLPVTNASIPSISYSTPQNLLTGTGVAGPSAYGNTGTMYGSPSIVMPALY